MIPIKIQCGCGQKYAFEVEPVGGRMPYPVTCPVCSTDATAVANEVITQTIANAPVFIPPSNAPLHVEAPARPATAASPRRPIHVPGQMERPQAVHEAKAKISWGDPPQEVLKYLMIQGFSYEEASQLVGEMFRERAATIRGNGIIKIIFGAILICVPIGAWVTFMGIGFMYLKLFSFAVMVGLYGIYNLLRGIFMVLAPKSEAGDVAAQ